MKLIILIALVFGCLFVVETYGQETLIENGWKGIKVFETKRAEIEKVFGQPIDHIGKLYTIYSDSEARIVVEYSDEPCSCATSDQGRYKLAKDTVTGYRVSLKKPFPLADLKWKKDLYDGGPSTHFPNVYTYLNQKDGLSITTEKGGGEMVHSFWFMSTNNQKTRFQCTSQLR